MKYSPKIYARAFVEALEGAKTSERESYVKNFARLLRKSGDLRHKEKIEAEIEKLLRIKTSKRKVIIETARPLRPRHRQALRAILKKDDKVEEKISPGLVAGVRITVNGSKQLDLSLSRAMRTLFAK